MDNRPVGVFDSGLGGLTAVKELERVLPGESIVYFGDTGRVPYGTKSRDTILRYARQDTAFLLRHGVKAILAACGTVSSVGKSVGEKLPVPYFDVIGPTTKAAGAATKNGRIGVIGTSTTISSNSYPTALMNISRDFTIFSQACPLFVPLVENDFISPDDPITRLTVERYLAPLIEAQVDTLILGCTHYPILCDTIAAVMGSNVTLINSGREAALALAGAVEEQGLSADGTLLPSHRFYVTDSPDNFLTVAEMFLGHSVEGHTEQIDIDKY